MKIAMIVRRLSTSGGTQRQAFELAIKLKERGHEICFYSLDSESSSCFFRSGVFPVIIATALTPGWLKFGLKLPVLSNLFRILSENLEAKAIAGRIDSDYDIVNAHDDVAYKASAIAKRRNPSLKIVWTMNDIVSRRIGAEKLKAVRDDYRPGFVKSAWFRFVDFLNFPYARAHDAIIVLDKRDYDWSVNNFGVKTFIVPSGLDVDMFPYIEHRYPGNKKVEILCAGIFFPHRRFEDVIIALSLLHKKGIDASLRIVGKESSDRVYFREIKILISTLQLTKYVELLGTVTEEQLLVEYANNDIFIFPSHLQSWGLAVFEALASGLPVIVSATAGASEVLENNETALIVLPKDPKMIAELVETITKSPKLYKNLGENGRKFVETNITWNKYADRVLEIMVKTKTDY